MGPTRPLPACPPACPPAGEAGAAPVSALPEWVDDGSLPVEGDGQLPFYLLDAHEEFAQPGVVFLFGKVPHKGQFVSCCTVVRGMQRNLFVVPRAAVGGEEIDALAAAAATDPAAKKQLIPLLHVSGGGGGDAALDSGVGDSGLWQLQQRQSMPFSRTPCLPSSAAAAAAAAAAPLPAPCAVSHPHFSAAPLPPCPPAAASLLRGEGRGAGAAGAAVRRHPDDDEARTAAVCVRGPGHPARQAVGAQGAVVRWRGGSGGAVGRWVGGAASKRPWLHRRPCYQSSCSYA